MKKIFLFSVIMTQFLCGCGAAPTPQTVPDESGDIATPQPVQPSATVANTDSKTPAPAVAAVDETAKQAELYCTNEIKKSELSPFEILNKKQIKACVVAIRPQIKKECFKNVKKDLVLKIIITKEGQVTGAFAIGDGADSVEAQCVAAKIKSALFPKFSSKETQIIEKYPISLGE